MNFRVIQQKVDGDERDGFPVSVPVPVSTPASAAAAPATGLVALAVARGRTAGLVDAAPQRPLRDRLDVHRVTRQLHVVAFRLLRNKFSFIKQVVSNQLGARKVLLVQ